MEATSSFDRLVAGLSSSERTAMLEKLQNVVDPETQSLVSSEVAVGGVFKDIELQMKSEPWFVRLWLFLKSLVTNTDIRVLYNARLVSYRGKLVEKNTSQIIDFSEKVFLRGFYDRVEELSNCANFFKEGLASYAEDPGGFYVFLSSLIAPEVARQISDEVNPSLMPFSREVTTELRVSLVRKMESIIQGIPSVKRAALYNAVCSVEWLKQFASLPFARILAAFTDEGSRYVCHFDTVRSEIAQFAKVLCNGKTIEQEVLEALFIFSSNSNSAEEENLSVLAAKYMETASAQISLIKMFINTVPMRAVGGLVHNDAFWLPERPDGCEDWFVKFKNTWRKAFDKQWEQWISDRKKDGLLQTMQQTFGFDKMPLLPDRPWIHFFGGSSFIYDYSLGFILSFYENVYPEYKRILKIVMLEGVFYMKDNLVELTDSCNELEAQLNNLKKLIGRLEEDGETRKLFDKLRYENLHTPRGKAKLDSLIKSLESEAAVILGQWCSSFRSIQLILGGIIAGVRNSRYDTLSNLGTIQGKGNADFRNKLLEVQAGITTALDIIKDLETLH
ncbi:MAG: hypothetical protein J6B81_04060 [Spirochaetaceae bacterium]|nr:hypothetical protein [Spirochaetaceae bacterium]